MAPSRRNILAVVTLFFVAPLVAEYLLGDLPLSLLAALIVLAPAYGGAAVLIREMTRRMGRGWPTMLLLGAAYALFGEGLVTQSLFNPDYLKMHMHLLDHAYIPALGIGTWWTLFMFNLHTFWSMGVSIALVEALFPAEAEAPWLGLVGDSVVAIVFLIGTAVSFGLGFKQNRFVASHAQLFSVAVLSGLLIVAAFLIPRRSHLADGRTASPWITGAIAFVLGLGVLNAPLIGGVLGMGVLKAKDWGWSAAGAMLTFDAVFLVLVIFFSRQGGWSPLHTLSLAAGGALDYGIHAFAAKPVAGGLRWMLISHVVFLVAALWVIWVGARRVIRYKKLV